MKRFVVVLACAALLVALPSEAGAAVRVSGKNCGTITGTQNNLRFQVYAKNVSCSTAFSVISRTLNGRRDARGWTCAQVVFPDDSTGTRCVRRGGRRVFGVPIGF